MKKLLLLLLFVSPFFSLHAEVEKSRDDDGFSKPSAEKPECVFLFVGEGVSGEMLELAGMYVENEGRPLNILSKLSVKGSVSVNGGDSFTFDLPSTATAIACGRETRPGFISSVDDPADGLFGVPSICHRAKIRGFKACVITDSEINSPVPASFFSASTSWKKFSWIAFQMVPSQFDYFGGKGMYGDNIEQSVVYSTLLMNGYTALKGKKELSRYLGKSKLIVKSPSYDAIAFDEDSDAVSLADHVGKAVSVFDGAAGFCVAVDARRIDEYCIDNDAASAVAAVCELDEAIGKAVEFMNTKKRMKTLVVFVSTGNAGGLKFTKNAPLTKEQLSILSAQKSTAKAIAEETAKFVACYDGQDEQLLFDRTKDFVSARYGINLDDGENALLKNLWNGKKETFNARLFTDAVRKFRDGRVGITWSGKGHYPYSIPVRAYGVGSQDFGREDTFAAFGKTLGNAVSTRSAADTDNSETETTLKEIK